MKRSTLSRALTLALAGFAAPAFAITDVENNASLPFSFSNPGARSLGMGGAFIGLADDATAAYANPAGLIGLGLEKQFSIEVRYNDFNTPYATSGPADPFTLDGIGYKGASDSTSNLSFLGFVWPSERWSLAVYRHQLADYENAFTSNEIDFDLATLFAVDGRNDLDIVNYGISFGWRWTDTLSIGAGLSWYDFDLDTVADRYSIGGTVGNAGHIVNTQRQRGDDDDIGFNLGILYRGTDNFQIGATYRSGPGFDYRHTNVAGPSGVFVGEVNANPGFVFANFATNFDAPDVFGVGLAWRVSDSLTLAFDVNHIQYSDLTEGLDRAFTDNPSPNDLNIVDRLRIDDVVEPRIGMEWVFLNMSRPLSLRAGAWYEERHTIRFQGDLNEFEGDLNNYVDAVADAILFSTGDDEMHYSVGIGWAFQSFQIDFAADFSDIQDTFALSGVWRF
ncbi:MAG TPA: outer membrane protein transport protein [Xanthomonadaceae bacterium]|nr:outer membrane protein transport protein [Xanthomonadaceae bacterium]